MEIPAIERPNPNELHGAFLWTVDLGPIYGRKLFAMCTHRDCATEPPQLIMEPMGLFHWWGAHLDQIARRAGSSLVDANQVPLQGSGGSHG